MTDPMIASEMAVQTGGLYLIGFSIIVLITALIIISLTKGK
jgi:hypothetical protein